MSKWQSGAWSQGIITAAQEGSGKDFSLLRAQLSLGVHQDVTSDLAPTLKAGGQLSS